ncbi:MAG TPA: DHA2 family efflux MFS transporter permease subunit [Burkholderiaceae bacterium]
MSESAAPAAAASASPASPPAPAPAAVRRPLTGSALVMGTLSLSLATFMNVLDSSIANVSLPAISGDLGVSTSQGTWVITSFGVANAISVPLTGWLTQRFGAVRLFTGSILLFVVASLLCGLAPSIEMLIAFRVLQGFVAGPMIPLSQTLLLSTYPPHKAGTALALWGVTTLVAPVVGPLLGGWLTDDYAWPWIFYINIPVGLFAAGVTWSIYKTRETPTVKRPIDGIGLAMLVVWVGSLQVMLDKGKELDWFNSSTIVTLAVVAVIAFAVFIAWELTDEHPIVDIRLFKGRNFLFGAGTLAIAYGLFFGNVVLLPLWLQQYMGYTATSAGMALAPVGVLAIMMTPFVGRNVQKWDPRWMATGAFILFSLVLWMRSNFTAQTDIGTILIPTFIQGGAMALFFIPLTTITLSGLPPERIPAAAGLSNFVRITLGAMGTSIATTIWDNRATLHHARLVEQMGLNGTQLDAATRTLSQVGIAGNAGYASINRLIDVQAFTWAADDVFIGSAVTFLFLIFTIWITKRPPKIAGGPSVDAGGAH